MLNVSTYPFHHGWSSWKFSLNAGENGQMLNAFKISSARFALKLRNRILYFILATVLPKTLMINTYKMMNM